MKAGILTNIFFGCILTASNVMAQTNREPHFVDHPVDTRPVKFGWAAKSPLDRDGPALAFRGGITYATINGFPNLTNSKGSILQNGKSSWLPGYTFGFLAEIPISDAFFVEPEFNLTRGGAKLSDSAGSHLHLTYLNLPVLLKYKPFEGFSIFGGPQADYLISGTVNTVSKTMISNYSQNSNFKSLGFSWTAGIGYGFESGLGFDLRYNQSLQTISKTNTLMATNSIIALSVRYFFYDLD